MDEWLSMLLLEHKKTKKKKKGYLSFPRCKVNKVR
jgi:hypothetical protein